jgi:hypothetical protein
MDSIAPSAGEASTKLGGCRWCRMRRSSLVAHGGIEPRLSRRQRCVSCPYPAAPHAPSHATTLQPVGSILALAADLPAARYIALHRKSVLIARLSSARGLDL